MAAALMKQPPADFVRLIFLGDISAANDREAPVLDPAIVGALQSADLVIANCDSPIVRRPYLPMRSWLGQRRHMNAGALLGVISAMAIETDRLVLSVANDSVLDQSIAGFEETLDTLRSLQIRTIGARRRGLIHDFSVGALTIGLVAFSEWRRGPRRRFRKRVLLTDDLPETEWLAETQQRPDILCAFPHWDRRRAEYPSVRTQKRAGRLVEQGVGLVAGHHMQRVQPVERVGATYIAYGLGTFHGGAATADLKQRIGAMFVVDISTVSWERGQIAAYELFPFVRLAERSRERIVPLDGLPQKQRRDVEAAIGHLSVRA
jgi:poly-gamma-glutamate synthesis protein (capsule biosynthesis protein)